MKWLITGDRTGYVPYEYVFATLEALYKEYNLQTDRDFDFCQGGAKGVDAYSDNWGLHVGVISKEYKADWNTHGKAAGPIRNQLMLDEFKPDLVVAFPAPTSRGTWDMVRRAKKAGVETLVYKYEG